MKHIILMAFILVSMGTTNSGNATETKKNKSIRFFNSEEHNSANLPFSEAVRVGSMLFLSGQIGVNTLTDKLVPGGLKAEAKQTMENIKNLLDSHGYSMSDIVKCTVMLADISEWQTFNDVYITYFSRPYPARSAFGVNGLALKSKVEVECIAAKGESGG